MDLATKVRFGKRIAFERVYSILKDNFGDDKIRVKGSRKVMWHAMLSMITLTAIQLFRFLV
jgi:hypothetical protein